jgi:hypothetical protein
MAIHNVRFRVPTRPIAHADIEFDVYKNGEMFGTLHVSKGAVVWRPRDKSKGRRLSWRKVDELFRDYGVMVKP